VKRAEMEQRLRTVEAKINFIMHTLALTRKDTQTGKVDSRTMDSLFDEAVRREVDAATIAEMADGAQPGPTAIPTPPSNPSELARQSSGTGDADDIPHG
jgi:hypothetical protein